MYIQYLGFDTSASSRIYSFHVIDVPREARDFTIKVQAEAFRRDCLWLQDGPAICYARLVQELGGQTAKSRAEASLTIDERDINDYLDQHRPKSPTRGKREIGAPPVPDERPEASWRWR